MTQNPLHQINLHAVSGQPTISAHTLKGMCTVREHLPLDGIPRRRRRGIPPKIKKKIGALICFTAAHMCTASTAQCLLGIVSLLLRQSLGCLLLRSKLRWKAQGRTCRWSPVVAGSSYFFKCVTALTRQGFKLCSQRRLGQRRVPVYLYI
jgi:hypothetical protein